MARESLSSFRDWTRERVVAHWERILATPHLPAVSYEYARNALGVLRGFERDDLVREPGVEG